MSRYGCAPAYPSLEELEFALQREVKQKDLRNDAQLEQSQWSTMGYARNANDWSSMCVFAFDHRSQLEEMDGYSLARGGMFKDLCLSAANAVAKGQAGFGILCDSRIGKSALHNASGSGLWVGRPVEWPGSRPLMLEAELGDDLGTMREWARENVVKCLCFCHPDDDKKMRVAQEATVKRVFEASRRNNLEFLLEIIPSKIGETNDTTTAQLIHQFYRSGIYPDWWKLEPLETAAAWSNAVTTIEAYDKHTRGIVVLGLDASQDDLVASFSTAAMHKLVKGFAVGRTIFGNAARAWFKGEITNDDAIADMTERFQNMCQVWNAARHAAQEGVQ